MRIWAFRVFLDRLEGKDYHERKSTRNTLGQSHAPNLRSCQYGLGYVIGTIDVTVRTTLFGPTAKGTEPQDHLEGCGRGRGLVPQSLYEDQLARRHLAANAHNVDAVNDH